MTRRCFAALAAAAMCVLAVRLLRDAAVESEGMCRVSESYPEAWRNV